MSLFSFVKAWGSNISQLTNSDRMMTNLVGTNPKSYHPHVYKSVIQYAQDIQEKYTKAGGEPLTVVEFSVVRLAFMAGAADKCEDFGTAQKYVDAVGKLRRSCPRDIRMKVGWDVDNICIDLQVRDSNPTGQYKA